MPSVGTAAFASPEIESELERSLEPLEPEPEPVAQPEPMVGISRPASPAVARLESHVPSGRELGVSRPASPGREPQLLPLDEIGRQNATKAAAVAAQEAEEEARKAARRAEIDAKYTPGGTQAESHALGPGYDESAGGASGMGARSMESLFDVEVKGGRKAEVQKQDPRVHTRIISDEELAQMLESGAPPRAVKASLKKRTEKGGLLGKAGLRNVESTGMPQQLVTVAMATKTAPIVLPIGWALYGFGTSEDLNIHNDPRDHLFGMSFGPKPTIDIPDAPRISGGLAMYRCSGCTRYLQAAEFQSECVFHPGSFTGEYGSVKARTRVWSCCKDSDENHPGCRRRQNHTEDVEFSRICRSLGQQIPAHALQAQADELRAKFPGAYGDGSLAVEVRVQGGDSINLQVLAPPQPSIAAVKTLLHAKVTTWHPERTVLSTRLGGEPLEDRSALTLAEGLAATGFACTGGCTRAVVLYARPQTAVKASDTASPEQQQQKLESDRAELHERKKWKKVPIRRGDSLQKLSLKYNLPVALIKSSNNIIGAEIEAWRDELWLPPSAAEGQKLR
jgi:hypothetical protein